MCFAAWSHLNEAVKNVILGARYNRVAADGPKITICTRKRPIVCQYFLGTDATLAEEEKMMYGAEGAKFMAHNGTRNTRA